MASIVGVYGVPHTPAFPKLVSERIGPAAMIERDYARVRAHLETQEPDLIIVLSDDHLNTFYLDNFPALAVGVSDATWGPNDGTDGLPLRTLASDAALASALRASLTSSGFETSLVQEFAVDHAMVVPLHFLTPDLDVPMIPLWINELVPPIPTASRAYALGGALRDALRESTRELRVAVVASGSFSLEVGGVHIAPDSNFGVPDPEWTDVVVEHLRLGAATELIELATPQRLHRAGNVGGELLAWLSAWGIVDGKTPEWVDVQPEFGHAFAAWEVET